MRHLRQSIVGLLLPLVVSLPSTASAGTWELTGTQRTRYETLTSQLLPDLAPRDDVIALQTSLKAEVTLERLRFVGEILDARALDNRAEGFVSNTVVNTLEPLQAHVEWLPGEHAGDMSLRIGRLTLDLGKRRLLSRNRFRNTVSNFVGADWLWRDHEGRQARAFYLTPMRAMPIDRDDLLDNDFELDHAFRSTRLAGAYYRFAERESRFSLELYVLELDAAPVDATLGLDTVSVGARAYRSAEPHHWHYEFEGVLQHGSSGTTAPSSGEEHHDAYFLHAEIGYVFGGAVPVDVLLQYDAASGDSDPFDGRNERFNTLFGDRRFDFGPTGIYGPFNRSNLITPGVRVTLAPRDAWQLMISYRSLRLASGTDTWVGTGYRDETGAAGRSLGRQLEGSAAWTVIPNRLSLELGAAALHRGRFARQASFGSRGDPRYFYLTATTTF